MAKLTFLPDIKRSNRNQNVNSKKSSLLAGEALVQICLVILGQALDGLAGVILLLVLTQNILKWPFHARKRLNSFFDISRQWMSNQARVSPDCPEPAAPKSPSSQAWASAQLT